MAEKITGEDLRKDLGPVKAWLSTGCTLLDLAIADRLPGGFPAGRISHVYGDESTGKTVLGSEALGSAQRQGGLASLDDVEGVWDVDRAEELHDVHIDDPEKWDESTSESIEDMFDNKLQDVIKKCVNIEGPCCRVEDSLSALSSKAEMDSKMTDGTYGTSRAKQLSAGFRKYIGPLNDSGLALIFIDQTRENVGVTWGDSVTTSGGKALRFYASVRVFLSYIERIKNTREKVVGVKLGFFTKKNKVAPPFREGTFRILFDYGIDDIGTSVEWLHENDPELCKQPKKSRPWEISKLKLKGRGLNALAAKVEDENLEKELVAEVERVWRLVYAPIERKKRVRFSN